ncbi:glutamate synthase-related protein [Aureivirga sp. CE67]|uniref:glutamate synthase-related protein n=1 Tax=Aureivirga sp. CE67 TaxID=1788983 RepID=UPI0018CA7882|nr:glutamate synthase-related protein [Aureivirga sp. CE67]
MKEKLLKLAVISELPLKEPQHALVANTDLVIIKHENGISILYGRCLHRGALLADGSIKGKSIVCGVHNWDYRYDTGVSDYNHDERLYKFKEHIKGDELFIDENEVLEFQKQYPQRYDRDEYHGSYADLHPEDTEPYTLYIKELAKYGLSRVGKHGFTVSMGVDRNTLPQWTDLQFLPAQLAKRPLLDEELVKTEVVIGKKAKKPLRLSMPIFVSDMSFGALSREAKISLSKGAEMAGTGICSGEGGMLPAEQENNSKYFYELASAKFGFSWEKLDNVQAFHFKGGQGAKTGTGGHLPGNKVSMEIAEVRGLAEGQAAISPATFPDFHGVKDFKDFAKKVRERTGGIPIGFKIAASHLEKDIDFALDVGVDYIILDGRGGGTGAAPSILRDNINVPTIPALARARHYLDAKGIKDVSLVVTGGLRTAEDFAKALMLGADAIAVSNAALQAIGCLGMRACSTNNCPVGVATQKESLRSRIIIDESAKQLYNYFTASNDLIKVIARACGYDDVNKFNKNDLSTFNYDMHRLTGVKYAGMLNKGYYLL